MMDGAGVELRALVHLIEAREAARSESTSLAERMRTRRGQAAWWEAGQGAGGNTGAGADLAIELGRARRKLESASEALEAAFTEAARSAPPLELVRMADRAITLARNWTGTPGDQPEAMKTQLEAIADFTVSTWLPGVDLRAVLHALDDENLGALPPPPPLRAVASWGWAPVDAAALFARVGHALGQSNLAALKRELASKKLADEPVVEKESFFERFMGDIWGSEALDVPTPDPDGLIRATENVHYALMEGLGAYPPLRAWLAATGAAGLIHQSFALGEIGIDPTTGAAMQSLPHVHRALLMRAIGAVARTIDEVFPAFAEIGAAMRSGQPRSRREIGPYRSSAANSTSDAENIPSDPRAQLARALEAVGAIARLDRAIAHGVMIHDIDTAKTAQPTRPFAGHLGSWGENEGVRETTTRRKWHTELVRGLCYEAWLSASRLRDRIPGLTVRDGILAVHEKARGIAMVRGAETSLRLAAVALTNTLHAIDALASTLRALLGGAFDRLTLMREVANAIAGRPATLGPQPWVTRLAADLAPTPFAALFARLTRHQEAFELASATRAAAESAMSFWDRLPLGSSAAKTEARRAEEELEALPAAIQADWSEACEVFDRAASAIPPMALGMILYEARDAVRRVRFESERVRLGGSWVNAVGPFEDDGRSEVATLYTTAGLREANFAIHRFTLQAMAVLGPMPSNGELLLHATTDLLTTSS